MFKKNHFSFSIIFYIFVVQRRNKEKSKIFEKFLTLFNLIEYLLIEQGTNVVAEHSNA